MSTYYTVTVTLRESTSGRSRRLKQATICKTLDIDVGTAVYDLAESSDRTARDALNKIRDAFNTASREACARKNANKNR